ncbi:MAG: transposase [Candidatus Polarisedimenticolaceae bacterium]|nr:transposase [Candidatus Polarisedimenticolaceae bacterium]
MPNYRRCRIPGGSYFFTINLLERDKALLTDNIELLRESVRKVKQKRPFHIDACVILPDHIHCIWTLPTEDDDYSGRWREIKKGFSKGLPKREYLSKVRVRRKERGIWQRRFWEHAIRNDEDYTAHMDYIHFNPVKHGWVVAVSDWPYSTFHRLVARGVYPENWGCDVVEDIQAGERG